MADLASSIVKINDIETASGAPVTEALMQKHGSTTNGLIDDSVDQDARLDALEGKAAAFLLCENIDISALTGDQLQPATTISVPAAGVYMIGLAARAAVAGGGAGASYSGNDDGLIWLDSAGPNDTDDGYFIEWRTNSNTTTLAQYHIRWGGAGETYIYENPSFMVPVYLPAGNFTYNLRFTRKGDGGTFYCRNVCHFVLRIG